MSTFIISSLTKQLRKTDNEAYFIPPDNGDIRWAEKSEQFSREEVAAILWAQIAIIGNDLKQCCGQDLTEEMFNIINDPRVPEF